LAFVHDLLAKYGFVVKIVNPVGDNCAMGINPEFIQLQRATYGKL
jgi:hypothetical protein